MAQKRRSDAARLAGLVRRDRAALMRSTALQAACALVLLLPAPGRADPAPNARPQGGVVTAGSASIVNSATITAINQSTQRAAIDWKSFDVGSQQAVQFNQPSSTAMTLNRVNSPDPSQIAGRITANGTIILTNPSGVVFSQGAQVNVQTLLVTTANVSNQNFMAGKLIFDQPGKPNAMVVNNGTINVAQTGLAALVAPGVANHGVINAKMGTVILAGAQAHTVDLYGDGLVAIDVTKQVTEVPIGPDGKPVAALVTNSGVIRADGGTVQLTAKAVDGIVTTLVDAGGTIAADTTASGRTGSVVLNGVGGSLTIEGAVSAAGNAPGTTGGSIEANATGTVTVARGAVVNASGRAGGGTVAIGTTLARAKGGPAVKPTMTAAAAVIESGARVAASAAEQGSGGNVTVLSTGLTRVDGTIAATGGAGGGNGGAVEVSGESLSIDGYIDVTAAQGLPGSILLDPTNLIIGNTSGTATNAGTTTINVRASSLSGNVTLTADNDITVQNAVNNASISSFTLDAGNNITVSAQISLSAGNIVLIAGNALGITAPVTTGSGNVALSAGTGGIAITNGANGTLNVGGSNLALAVAPGGTISLGDGNNNHNVELDAVGGTLSLRTDNINPGNKNVILNAGTSGVVEYAPATTGGTLALSGALPGLDSSGTITTTASLLRFGSAGGTITASAITTGTTALSTSIGTLDLEATAAIATRASVTAGTLVTATAPAITVGDNSGHAGAFTVGNGGTILLQTDTLTPGTGGAVLSAPAGLIGIAPITAGTTIALAAPSSAGTLGFAGFSNFGAGTLRLGNGAATPITIAAVDISGLTPTLDLRTTAAVTQTGSLKVGTLAGSVGSIVLGDAGNQVAALGNLASAGTLAFTNSVALGIAASASVSAAGIAITDSFVSTAGTAALAIAGTLATTGSLALAATGAGAGTAIAISGPVGGTGAALSLSSAGGDIAEASGGSLTGASLAVPNAAGTISLAQANAIAALGGVTATGPFTLADTVPLSLPGGTTLAAAAISIADSAASSPGTIALDLQGTLATTGLVTLAATDTASAGQTGIRLGGAIGGPAAALDLSTGSADIVQNGGTLWAATLRSTGGIGGGATLDQANTIGALGNLAVTGGLTLTDTAALGLAGTASVSAGAIAISDSFASAPGTPAISIAGTLAATGSLALAATTAGTATAIALTGTLGSATALVSLSSAGGDILQTAGVITAARVSAPAAAGVVTLNQANAIAGLGDVAVTGGNDFILVTTAPLAQAGTTTVSAQDISITGRAASSPGTIALDLQGGLAAPGTIVVAATDTASAGATGIRFGGAVGGATATLDLRSASADILQNGGSIQAAALLSSGGTLGGSTTLLQATNQIALVQPITAAGDFVLADQANLTVTGPFSVTTAGHRLGFTQTAANGTISIGDGVTAGTLSVASAAGNPGTISLQADNIVIGAAGGTIAAAGGVVEVAPTTAGTLALGAVSSAGTLGFNLYANTTADTLRLGGVGGTLGAANVILPVAANLTAAGIATLDLATTGTFTQTAGSALTVNTLSGTAGSWTLTEPANAIAVLGNATASTGGFVVYDGTGLTIAGTLSAGTADLSVAGNLTEDPAGAVNVTLLQSTSGVAGNVSLGAANNHVAGLGSFNATGTFALRDAAALTIPAGSTITATGIVLSDSFASTAATPAITLAGSLGAGGTLRLDASSTLAAGHTAIALGGNIGGATVDLASGSGDIAQTGTAGIITATRLTSTSGITGSVLLSHANAVTTVGGISVAGGNFELTDASALAVTGTLAATGAGAHVWLTDTLPGTGPALSIGDPIFLTPGSIAVGSGGTIGLLADSITFAAGTLAAPSGVIALAPFSVGTIALGALSSPGTFGVVPGALPMTASSLRLGALGTTPGTAAITIAGIDLSAQVGTLDLRTTGGVSQTGALTVNTVTGHVGTIDLTFSTNQIPVVRDLSSDGALNLYTANNLTVAGTVSATGTQAVLFSTANLTLDPSAVVSSGSLVLLDASGTYSQAGGVVSAPTVWLYGGTGLSVSGGSVVAGNFAWVIGGSAATFAQSGGTIASLGSLMVGNPVNTLNPAGSLAGAPSSSYLAGISQTGGSLLAVGDLSLWTAGNLTQTGGLIATAGTLGASIGGNIVQGNTAVTTAAPSPGAVMSGSAVHLVAIGGNALQGGDGVVAGTQGASLDPQTYPVLIQAPALARTNGFWNFTGAASVTSNGTVVSAGTLAATRPDVALLGGTIALPGTLVANNLALYSAHDTTGTIDAVVLTGRAGIFATDSAATTPWPLPDLVKAAETTASPLTATLYWPVAATTGNVNLVGQVATLASAPYGYGASGSLSITGNTGDLLVDGPVTSGGSITLGTTGTLTIGNNATVTATTLLKIDSGNYQQPGGTIGGASIDINGLSLLTLTSGTIHATGSLTLAGGNLDMSGGLLLVDGNLTLGTGTGTAGTPGSAPTPGIAINQSGGTISAANIAIWADAGSGVVQTGGTIAAAGSLGITSAGAISQGGGTLAAVMRGTTVRMLAGGDATQGANATVAADPSYNYADPSAYAVQILAPGGTNSFTRFAGATTPGNLPDVTLAGDSIDVTAGLSALYAALYSRHDTTGSVSAVLLSGRAGILSSDPSNPSPFPVPATVAALEVQGLWSSTTASVTGNVSLTASQVSYLGYGPVGYGATGSFNLGNTSPGGTLLVMYGQGATVLPGVVAWGGTLDLRDSGAISLAGPLGASGNATVAAGVDLYVTGSAALSSGGTLALNAGGTFSADAGLINGAAVAVTGTAGVILSGATIAGPSIAIGGGGFSQTAGLVSGTGAGAQVTLTPASFSQGGGTIASDGGITIGGGSGAGTAAGTIAAGADTSFTQSGGAIAAAGDIAIYTSGGLTQTAGTIAAGGTLAASAATGISQGGGALPALLSGSAVRLFTQTGAAQQGGNAIVAGTAGTLTDPTAYSIAIQAPGGLNSFGRFGTAATVTATGGYAIFCPSCNLAAPAFAAFPAVPAATIGAAGAGAPDIALLGDSIAPLGGSLTAHNLALYSQHDTTASVTAALLTGRAGVLATDATAQSPFPLPAMVAAVETQGFWTAPTTGAVTLTNSAVTSLGAAGLGYTASGGFSFASPANALTIAGPLASTSGALSVAANGITVQDPAAVSAATTATLQSSGTYLQTGGLVNAPGVTISAPSGITIQGGAIAAGPSNATILLSGGAFNMSGGTIAADGANASLAVTPASFTLSGGILASDGALRIGTGTGTAGLPGGAATSGGAFTQNGGSIVAVGDLTLWSTGALAQNGGVIAAGGTLAATVSGNISQGTADLSGGTVRLFTVNGSVTQAAGGGIGGGPNVNIDPQTYPIRIQAPNGTIDVTTFGTQSVTASSGWAIFCPACGTAPQAIPSVPAATAGAFSTATLPDVALVADVISLGGAVANNLALYSRHDTTGSVTAALLTGRAGIASSDGSAPSPFPVPDLVRALEPGYWTVAATSGSVNLTNSTVTGLGVTGFGYGATGSFSFSGAAPTGGMTVMAGQGPGFQGGVVAWGGNTTIAVTNANPLVIQGPVAASGNTTITTAGALHVTGSGALSAGGTLAMNVSGPYLQDAGLANAPVVALTANDGTISGGAIVATSSLSITSAGFTIAGGSLAGAQVGLAMSGGGDFVQTGGALTSDGAFVFDGGTGTAGSLGSAPTQTAGAFTQSGGVLAAAGNLSLWVPGALTQSGGTIAAGGLLGVTAGSIAQGEAATAALMEGSAVHLLATTGAATQGAAGMVAAGQSGNLDPTTYPVQIFAPYGTNGFSVFGTTGGVSASGGNAVFCPVCNVAAAPFAGAIPAANLAVPGAPGAALPDVMLAGATIATLPGGINARNLALYSLGDTTGGASASFITGRAGQLPSDGTANPSFAVPATVAQLETTTDPLTGAAYWQIGTTAVIGNVSLNDTVPGTLPMIGSGGYGYGATGNLLLRSTGDVIIAGGIDLASQSGAFTLTAPGDIGISTAGTAVTLQAATMLINAGNTLTVGNGTSIFSGGDTFTRPPPGVPPTDPLQGILATVDTAAGLPAGSYLLAGPGGFTQSGLLTVSSYVPANPAGATVTVHPVLYVGLTAGVGTVAFDPVQGIFGPTTALMLNIGAGTASGNINADSLALFYTGTTSPPTNLTGTLRTVNGVALYGQSVASQAYIAQNAQFLPNNHFKINGCALSSVNCVLISLFPQAPVIDPFRDLLLGLFSDPFDDPDLLLPNVSDRDY